MQRTMSEVLEPVCRWIERYNNKLRQPAKKEEGRRLKQFVNDAFAQDPRILQRRAEEKAMRYTHWTNFTIKFLVSQCFHIMNASRQARPCLGTTGARQLIEWYMLSEKTSSSDIHWLLATVTCQSTVE